MEDALCLQVTVLQNTSSHTAPEQPHALSGMTVEGCDPRDGFDVVKRGDRAVQHDIAAVLGPQNGLIAPAAFHTEVSNHPVSHCFG